MNSAALVAFAAGLACAVGHASERSQAARAEFQRTNPCPATGKSRGPCHAYVVDHVTPLCAGGPDHPSNMQWQESGAAKVKDLEEVRQCRAMRSSQQRE